MATQFADDMLGIDDDPPERVAHFAAQEAQYALEKCAFKSSDQWLIRQAIRVLQKKADG